MMNAVTMAVTVQVDQHAIRFEGCRLRIVVVVRILVVNRSKAAAVGEFHTCQGSWGTSIQLAGFRKCVLRIDCGIESGWAVYAADLTFEACILTRRVCAAMAVGCVGH